jgi:glycerophosphoryl diester phosphodiesterase
VIRLERRDGRPLRIGHRGAAALAPENTLRAMRAALAVGVDLIEIDVLALDDGELVVAHSNDLFEVSHGAARGTVQDKALSELRELAPELPTLAEALDFFIEEAPGAGLHVDLKSAAAARDVAAVLGRVGLLERALVSSFRVDVVRELSRLEPGLRAAVSFPEDRLGVSRRRGSRPLVGVGLRGLRPFSALLAGRLVARSGATALSLQHRLVTAALVSRLHRRGVAVIGWTVENRRDLERVDAAGVDAVVVDDPRLFEPRLG